MKFSLTKKQEKMIAKWVKKQDKAYAKKNNSELGYYGAIDGGNNLPNNLYKYRDNYKSFTPNRKDTRYY